MPGIVATRGMVSATELAQGAVRLATTAEAQALASALVAMTPARVNDLIASISTLRTGTAADRLVSADALASLWQQGSDIASAATLVKPSDANLGGYHVITGTTGISAGWSGDPAGTTYEFRFAGACLLTHGASFIMPTGANVTTQAGDVVRFRIEASNVWRVVSAPPSWYPLTAVTKLSPVRQTVLSGPVDSNGFPSFGGSTGSTTVTVSGTLRVSAANGFDANGQVDRVGSIVNPSWTSLSTNGTMFLYLEVAADGTCTTGSVPLAPNYRFGGADVVTNNQHTFNIQEMVMKVGNGSSASAVYRVFVGEVTVAGGVVTAITWYALNGRYTSAWTSTLPGVNTNVTFSHNLGSVHHTDGGRVELECLTTEFGWAVGDLAPGLTDHSAGYASAPTIIALSSRLSCQFITGSTWQWSLPTKGGGNRNQLTAANWRYRLVLWRKW